ncbi:radical SAM protein [Petrotoga olearia]|uniref:Radical SAM core domain-containing protein n=2 Tax=Petrotoga olearia TaxID=156203 RepID=A0A2K1P193_9BACT|nr:radical SAM protein [Petrotoga olearia]PNR96544.1 hypothetical protein X929_04475 [Petrotoga olearia DSM 13574]RMA76584.1 radical SAM protein with 4Fe4S-binding SPASM domain [Petrotoga olearia]
MYDINKYAILNNHYKLLEFPTYGVLQVKSDNMKNRDRIIQIDGKENIEKGLFLKQASSFINHDAVELFKLCNGSKTLKEIFEMFSNDDKIRQFLFRAIERNHVSLVDKPSVDGLDVRGTKDFFLPLHMSIELTDGCNLNCKYCYRREDIRKSTFIDSEKLKVMVEKLNKETLSMVEITGGEPTLHPHFTEILKYILERGITVGVLTNGVKLPENSTEELEPYADKIIWGVSLDSYDPEYHDKFRGKKGAWESTVKNIKKLVNHNFFVRVAMVVTPENIDQLDKTAELSVNLGARFFTFSASLPFGKGKNIEWKEEYALKLFEEGNKVIKKYEGIIPIVQEESGDLLKHSKNCGAGWKNFTVGPDFAVRPCVMSEPKRDVIGIIDPDNPTKFFENHKEETFFYSKIVPPNREICGDCELLHFCWPCILRARKAVEDGLMDIDKCKWMNDSYVEFLKVKVPNRGDKNVLK